VATVLQAADFITDAELGRDMETMGVAMKLRGHWKQIQSLRYASNAQFSSSKVDDRGVT
jgi:hypothetical protein